MHEMRTEQTRATCTSGEGVDSVDGDAEGRRLEIEEDCGDSG